MDILNQLGTIPIWKTVIICGILLGVYWLCKKDLKKHETKYKQAYQQKFMQLISEELEDTYHRD